MFEQRVRQELTLAPLQEPIANGNITAKSNVERYLGLLISSARRRSSIAADTYLKDVKIDDAAVKAFYDANQGCSRCPTRRRSNTLRFTPESQIAKVKVEPDEAKAVRR
jgi:hypothetical protein